MLKNITVALATTAILGASLYGANVEGLSFYKTVKGYKKGELGAAKRNATPAEVIKAVKGGNALLLDFRSEDEKNAAKIPFAHEVRADHFTKELDTIVKKNKIKNIDTIYLVCRTASRAAYQTMAWDGLMKHIQKTKPNFNIEAKTLSLKTYAQSCNPLESLEDDVNGAHLHAKKVFLKLAKDGNYYSDKCTNIKFK
ncbi:MAG: rhodanese-like domain-containing protein [Campylobacterota bacterium]|nr:rhodanese-like domain-containing protein [Campylobacterota bacterium]